VQVVLSGAVSDSACDAIQDEIAPYACALSSQLFPFLSFPYVCPEPVLAKRSLFQV
jgi:hypothetical protein